MSNYLTHPNDNRIRPVGLDDANLFITEHHRYLGRLHRCRFGLQAFHRGQVVGVILTTPPTNNKVDDGVTLEIARLCTHLAPYQTASALVSRVCRIAKLMGFERVITYVDAEQAGISYTSVNFKRGQAFLRRPWKGRMSCFKPEESMYVRRLDLEL